MTINNAIPSLSQDLTTLSVPKQKIIAECRKILVDSLPRFFNFLARLDREFYTLQLPAESTSQQDDYLMQVRTLLSKQEKIRSACTHLILDEFDAFWVKTLSQPSPHHSVDNIKPTVIQNHLEQENKAISHIIKTSKPIFADELQHLNLRFTRLINTKQFIDTPISIQQFLNHFQTVISSFITDHKIKLITYQHFGKMALPIFLELYAKLNNTLIEQERLHLLATIQCKRNAGLVQGNDLINSLRIGLNSDQNEVDETIQHLLKHYAPVPKFIRSFIESEWKYSFNQYHDSKSPEWKQIISLIDQLLWSVSPKVLAHERKKLLTVIPTLLKSLREILNISSLNKKIVTSFLIKLQEYHLEGLHEHSEEVINSVDLDTANQLAIGTWLDLSTPNKGEIKRIKFSWRSQLTGRCIFINQDGVLTASPTLNELANWFNQGSIRIVNIDVRK